MEDASSGKWLRQGYDGVAERVKSRYVGDGRCAAPSGEENFVGKTGGEGNERICTCAMGGLE